MRILTAPPGPDSRTATTGILQKMNVNAALLVLLGLMAALHLHLALTRTIHWDEFHYLRQVHEFARGELTLPLQTLHVHLFSWLADSDLPAVDQIIRGRLVMFAAMAGTCTAIVWTALRFTTWPGALICALAYLAFGYVVHHGASFRTDPLAAFLCMSALAIFARSHLRPTALILAAAALGLAFMVTIKMVLYLPAFAGVAWLRWSQSDFSHRRFGAIAALPVLALVFAGALYAWHSGMLANPQTGTAVIGNSGVRMFGTMPKFMFIAMAAITGFPLVVMLAMLVRTLAGNDNFDRDTRIALATLAAPLLALVFYTNTFPYFYAFILPPVCIAIAGAIPSITARWGLLPVALLMAGNGAVIWAVDADSRQDQQRQIEVAVNQMFPQPVAYFDFPGLLPRHHKANFFMSAWGFRNYHATGEPHFAKIMEKQAVPLLLTVESEQNPTLLAVMQETQNARLFYPEDREALRETYRHVWGPVYLPGTLLEPGTTRQWNVRVPGAYTVEGPLAIDGRPYFAGDVVELSRGPVTLVATTFEKSGLLWGRNLELPAFPAPGRPYWRGF